MKKARTYSTGNVSKTVPVFYMRGSKHCSTCNRTTYHKTVVKDKYVEIICNKCGTANGVQ